MSLPRRYCVRKIFKGDFPRNDPNFDSNHVNKAKLTTSFQSKSLFLELLLQAASGSHSFL